MTNFPKSRDPLFSGDRAVITRSTNLPNPPAARRRSPNHSANPVTPLASVVISGGAVAPSSSTSVCHNRNIHFIMGNASSGKSWLCRHIAERCAELKIRVLTVIYSEMTPAGLSGDVYNSRANSVDSFASELMMIAASGQWQYIIVDSVRSFFFDSSGAAGKGGLARDTVVDLNGLNRAFEKLQVGVAFVVNPLDYEGQEGTLFKDVQGAVDAIVVVDPVPHLNATVKNNYTPTMKLTTPYLGFGGSRAAEVIVSSRHLNNRNITRLTTSEFLDFCLEGIIGRDDGQRSPMVFDGFCDRFSDTFSLYREALNQFADSTNR